MIEFRVSTLPATDETMVEVWHDDTFVAGIYGHEKGVRLVSKYLEGVIDDPGRLPAVVIILSEKG